ncbi:MAG: nitroreductase [Chitinophagaceae bacterium]
MEQLQPKQLRQYFLSRRSTFIDQFVPGQRIADATIEQILDNANTAPTHKRTEPWRFTVFCDQGLESLALQQAALYKQCSGSSFKESQYQKLLTTPQRCSHVIALGMKRHDSVPEQEEIAAAACAVQNIYLSLSTWGIGGYWSTGGITYFEEAKALFGLEKADRFLGFFYLGVVQTPSQMREAGDVALKTTWVRE